VAPTRVFTLGIRVNENAFCKNKAKQLLSPIYITYLDTKICLDTSILAVSNMDLRGYGFGKNKSTAILTKSILPWLNEYQVTDF
jgi:hypothetical protein